MSKCSPFCSFALRPVEKAVRTCLCVLAQWWPEAHPECCGAVRAGNDSPQIPPPTGAPAIVVPMGFTNGSTHAPLPTSLHVRPHVLGRQIEVVLYALPLLHF